MPALDRVSMVFFLAALVLVASDKIYLGHYSQSPNYLAILAVVGAVFGLVNRTGPALIAAPAPDEFPIAAGAQRWSVFAVFLAFLAFYAVTGNLEPAPTMPMCDRRWPSSTDTPISTMTRVSRW